MDVKGAIVRLNNTKIDPADKKLENAIKDGSFSDEKFARGDYTMSAQEKELSSYNIPAILLMNKVDLCSSKRKLKELQESI